MKVKRASFEITTEKTETAQPFQRYTAKGSSNPLRTLRVPISNPTSRQKFLAFSTAYKILSDVTTNTIEGVFSIFKRGMKGIYQHCSEKHLHRYLAEYDFRYNNRERLGVNDMERTANALGGIVGKRLLYRDSSKA